MMIAVVVFGVGAAILLATGGVEGQDAYGLAIAAAVTFVSDDFGLHGLFRWKAET
jgi:hypothetical protein